MIEFTNTEIFGWEAAVRGMRNPMNSWEKSDSGYKDGVFCEHPDGALVGDRMIFANTRHEYFDIGENDHKLMMSLASGGSVHAKYRRMITVYVDILAPLYWWKEFDTYKVGTVANSCSTMHKIFERKFVESDFSFGIFDEMNLVRGMHPGDVCFWPFLSIPTNIVTTLNNLRDLYLETEDETYWRAAVEILPCCYNQLRTVMLNYEVLTNIYSSRKGHRLSEWRAFVKWIEGLPHSEIIIGSGTGNEKEEK